jgi:hypothetical protein
MSSNVEGLSASAAEAEMAVVLWWKNVRDCSSPITVHLSMGSDSNALFMRHHCSKAQRLSGGFVNFVCRAYLESCPDSINQEHTRPCDTCSSVIVKRFAPSIHNSCSYEIERTALWLCNSVRASASASQPAIEVRVPRLLAFDDLTRTIVMEDAGVNAKMLSDWLLSQDSQIGASDKKVGGVTAPEAASHAAEIAIGWPELTADIFASAIASFYGKNHAAPDTLRMFSSLSGIDDSSSPSPPFRLQVRGEASHSEKCQWYAHFSANALAFGVPPPIVEALSPAVPENSSRWPRRVDAVHDGWDWSVEKLANAFESSGVISSGRWVDDSKVAAAPAAFSPAKPSLIVGDLWPNSVLIDPSQRTVWVVDWEASQIGCPGRDVALLIDHLWIMMQNPSKYDAARASKLISSLGYVFFPAYPGSGFDSASAPSSVADWRLGREPEFLRSVAMFAGSPHYGIDHSAALRCALGEIATLSELRTSL